MSRSQAFSRLHRLFPILIVVLAGMLLQGCGDDGPQPVVEEPIPTEAVQIDAAYEVRRWDGHDNAWATLSDATHFDQLTDDDTWEALVAQGLVTTDSSGEAELCEVDEIVADTNECDPDACHIFVYGDSDFGHHWCPTSGYTDCTGSATLSFEDCHITLATLSADITGLGTWFSVTYLWDTQVTLVIAGEGEVQVTPIRTLTFEGDLPPMGELPPKERAEAWDEVLVVERTPGEAVSVRIDPNTEPARYLYTAPDEVLEELGLPQIVSDRKWLGMETLPLLRGRLEMLEPRLEPWLGRVWMQGEADGIRLGPWLPVSGLRIVTVGEPWENDRVLDALLLAVDWQWAMETLTEPDQGIGVYRGEPFGPQDLLRANAKELPYDPEKSMALLEEEGYSQLQVAILSPGDPQLLNMAGRMAEVMGSAGFYAIAEQLEAEPALQYETIQAFLDEGFALVLLNRETR